MREIKFRCFYMGEMFTGLPLVEILKLASDDGAIDMDEVEGALFLQYTGLKDKNGKEIYEGDIVVQHTEWAGGYNSDDFGEHENKGVVAIVPSKGVMINRCVKRDLIECEQDWSKTWPVNLRACRVVVIGNIHENPELLDNAK